MTDYLWSVIFLPTLVVASAFFSGSETAFFNLSKRQLNELFISPKKSHRLTAALLSRPKNLMTSLLLGNMTVNVLYFAAASSLSLRISADYSRYAAAVVAVVGFILLVIFGEMLPKSFAYKNSFNLSVILSLPAFICIYIFTPIRFVLNGFFVIPILRLISPARNKKKQLTSDQFKVLIDSSSQKGLITPDENKFLSAVVELGVLKTRHIMRPRVDMVLCRGAATGQKALSLIKKHNKLRVFVYSVKLDNVIGYVPIRKLLLNPERQLKDIAEEVRFIPEQKRVDDLLDTFLSQKFELAVVVDEFGQIAGVVSLDDIIDHLLGGQSGEEIAKPIEQIGPMQYRLAGDLSIHHWAEDFGFDYTNARFSTIAGLTVSLLGKVPKAGDVVYMKNLKITVEKVQKHRIKSIILSFESMAQET